VAVAYARTHARFAQIDAGERAVRSGEKAFREDLNRTRNLVEKALPIEMLDSFRLLARSRYLYLDSIIDYNRAQFELYVALGQPPARCLARPVPANLVPPPNPGHGHDD
jgi:outer membrane protein TolC